MRERIYTEPFQYAINEIKVVSFAINEPLVDTTNTKSIRANFNYSLSFDAEKGIVNFSLKTSFFYDDLTIDQPIAFIEVENHFFIENLKNKVDGKDVILPDAFWLTILGMSITHSRALFAHYIGSTVLHGKLIPIVNPVDVAKAFFPQIDFTAIGKPPSKPPVKQKTLKKKKGL